MTKPIDRTTQQTILMFYALLYAVYYGARYLDPKTSRWLSTDPVVGEYIPGAPVNDEVRKKNQNLPGMGGVFNTVNYQLYHYAGNNPVKYTDPTGRQSLPLYQPTTPRTPAPPTTNAPEIPQITPSVPNVAPPVTDGTVYADRGGTVTGAGWADPNNHNSGNGWQVTIDTGDGYNDIYGHLDPESTPEVGARIREDGRVGEMANPTNGESTGPHVHRERIRQSDGRAVDPGTRSPFGGPSRITSGFNRVDPGLRGGSPHRGVDHVPAPTPTDSSP